ncbi:peptide chain release factor 1 [Candidatus Blochmannia ocreatus (nom. nud.)]|uniref:Peptide chain release factor 1 n=1 Tax=Candidatus Blochmannia ocreatus (nom. nud.) TaxID=251538 RepID=A0ABY4SX64_9ENTR|nr:peptide chain release factor 1 [Candidatus Blochmannia ocreatus]URJ24858.1 peptide chain release factor 1 [Candidatus Blochmannia ocreatus]
MDPIIITKLIILKKRFDVLKKLINTPKILYNKKKFLLLHKEHTQLFEIVTCFQNWLNTKQEINNIKNMLTEKDMYDLVQDELKIFNAKKINLENQLTMLLLPEDKNDKLGCFIELRAGTGGKEAAIFTAELFRMYTRYAELRHWNIEIIHIADSEYEGYKEIIIKIPNKGAYSQLKFESGGHRVQRIPHTESQGRIHTSTCTIAVIPEIPYTDFPKINSNDLRIDSFRASGAGGQHVNTTDSAIRIIHIPSGLTVECQDERSQHKNKAKALSILNSRLHALETKRRQKEESNTRRNLLGTGDRSDRIRTYNFQQGRVTDHRISFTSHKLHNIMHGDLDILIKPIINKYKFDQLNKLLQSK